MPAEPETLPTVERVPVKTGTAVVTPETIDDVLAELEGVWPTIHDDVLLPLEEDGNGVCHDIRREVRCTAPARIVELRLGELLVGERCCTKCVPEALRAGGRISRDLSVHTLCLRVALDAEVTATERASAAVLTVWNGPSRFLPRPVFEKVRTTVLLPLLAELAEEAQGRDASSTGPLVAFTAGDMRLGMGENPELYRLTARGAAASLVHASPRDGVWLLHDPYSGVGTGLPRWPGLGTVLLPAVRRSEIDPVACEIFGVLADDALAGLSSWEDIHQWWAAANHLNR